MGLRLGIADSIYFDRQDMWLVYKELITVAQMMFCNKWESIIGNYSNKDSLLIAYAYNQIACNVAKESKNG